MKSFVFLLVLAAIVCFIAGCGPGQPFEIEEHFASQNNGKIQVAVEK